MILSYDFTMKIKYLLVAIVLMTFIVFGSCRKEEAAEAPYNFLSGLENLTEDTSYAFGMLYGADILNMFITNGIIPYLNEFTQGLNDVLIGNEPRFDIDQAYEIFNAEVNSMMSDQIEYYRQEGTAFLADNAKRDEVKITSSGLQYEVVIEGTGPKPSATSSVKVDYEGSLLDGTVFDSSFSSGEPLVIELDRVIQGWTEGLQLMGTGSQYIFYIPYDLGYGATGYGTIPPYATLIFFVELHEIIN